MSDWVVLVTGSRVWKDDDAIERDMLGARWAILGDNPSGADRIGLLVAIDHGIIPIVLCAGKRWMDRVELITQACPKRDVTLAADWDVDGKHVAGPKRNRAMVARAAKARARGIEVRPFAYPTAESVGTWNCVRALQEAGFGVKVRER